MKSSLSLEHNENTQNKTNPTDHFFNALGIYNSPHGFSVISKSKIDKMMNHHSLERIEELAKRDKVQDKNSLQNSQNKKFLNKRNSRKIFNNILPDIKGRNNNLKGNLKNKSNLFISNY